MGKISRVSKKILEKEMQRQMANIEPIKLKHPPQPAYPYPCPSCKHLNEWNGEAETCKAFPDGIPEEILMGKNKHKRKLPDQDNDLVFEMK